MFDYKLIEAMAEVIREGGFDKAAARLCLTQSAVSQRVRQLEEQAGQILLTRTVPPEVTRAGQWFLAHYLKVKHLEENLAGRISPGTEGQSVTLSVGVNADSLTTWFPRAVAPMLADGKLLLDIRVDDQDQTHKFLKNGTVCGCISTLDRALQGCKMFEIGTMAYQLMCTPAFACTWFADGVTTQAVLKAPAVIFNRKDKLHAKMLATVFADVPKDIPVTYVPSSETFVDFIALGLGYGMVPIVQGRHLVRKKVLTALLSGRTIDVRLFWHCWNLKSPLLESFTKALLHQGRKSLDVFARPGS
ncbi:LysR family transcriptional regulator ArgP [uncultured Desulfobacter sp.]|uniref:LysR family transcriptional regulator ArgP n=1 Tax=uncultured Desulfobacter sp. TaxID=240139 RepID=UPI002AABD674|nr:LysR family transcriptional regulator ArgP [uncultured Desulfobacter sp.]